MKSELDRAIDKWRQEVDAEAVKLLESGTPPREATTRARGIVERRRRQEPTHD